MKNLVIFCFLTLSIQVFSQSKHVDFLVSSSSYLRGTMFVQDGFFNLNQIQNKYKNNLILGTYYTSLGKNYNGLVFLRHGLELQFPLYKSTVVNGFPKNKMFLISNAIGLNFLNKPNLKSFFRLESKLNLSAKTSEKQSTDLNFKQHSVGLGLGIHPFSKKNPFRIVYSLDIGETYQIITSQVIKSSRFYNSRIGLEAGF
jgi:hypothetical protein